MDEQKNDAAKVTQTIRDSRGGIVRIETDGMTAFPEGRQMTTGEDYATDLNLLRVPLFTYGKNTLAEYQEERLIHGKLYTVSVEAFTFHGALTAFDYNIFRGMLSFLYETPDGKVFSRFNRYQLCKRLGYEPDNYYERVNEALDKLKTFKILFKNFIRFKDGSPGDLESAVFPTVISPKIEDGQNEFCFIFNSDIGNNYIKKYFCRTSFDTLLGIESNIGKRLYEYLNMELYNIPIFKIGKVKLARRVGIQDQRIRRVKKTITSALDGLRNEFHYHEKEDILHIRKNPRKHQQPEAQRNIPEAVILNPSPQEWGSGHKLYELWERFYLDRYNVPFKPSYRPRVMQYFREIEQNYNEAHITKGIKVFFTDYDRSTDKKRRYWTGNATPGIFRKFVLDKGMTAAEEARKAERQRQQLDEVRTWAREAIYERLRKILPGQELPENITLDQVKAFLGDKWTDEAAKFEYLFQRL